MLVRASRPSAAAAPQGDPELVVLLEDIQDPRNLGALLRVCEGAGVGRVLVRDRGSAPLAATAVKASAGASEWLQVERVSNAPNAILDLRKQGFWIYGADAMHSFTQRYKALMAIDYSMLPYWDLYAALRLARLARADLAEWTAFFQPFGRPDITEQTLRAHYHMFVSQAFEALAG